MAFDDVVVSDMEEEEKRGPPTKDELREKIQRRFDEIKMLKKMMEETEEGFYE